MDVCRSNYLYDLVNIFKFCDIFLCSITWGRSYILINIVLKLKGTNNKIVLRKGIENQLLLEIQKNT